MVTKEEVQGNWKSIVGVVKEKFGQITGDELTALEGNMDKLIGLVQRKSGQSREWVESFISEATTTSKNAVRSITENTSQYANQAAEMVKENYDHLSESAQKGYEQMSDAAQRGYDSTIKTVSNRPVESVAIALGLGVLSGLVVGLSMASKRR